MNQTLQQAPQLQDRLTCCSVLRISGDTLDVGELVRQPRASRQFFDKYQDRIVFGTDASPSPSTPQQLFGDLLYEIYYRFLETDDEYFDYAPAPLHSLYGTADGTV